MISQGDPKLLEEAVHGPNPARPGDNRSTYKRERARILHSSAFRRLQGKTQVMGVGEGDFHRTRLTHSIEVAQIGEGILDVLQDRHRNEAEIIRWLPCHDLLSSACFAHDLGHPPFGHAGEVALQEKMSNSGGFEGNAQTLRIIARLEKYTELHGINPSKRLVLAVLKYPVPYSASAIEKWAPKPPKCYYDEDQDIVTAALKDFSKDDLYYITKLSSASKPKPMRRSLDAAIMELADDIAYGVHDLEDVVGRKFVLREELDSLLTTLFADIGILKSDAANGQNDQMSKENIIRGLFGSSVERKETIGRLVNIFVTSAKVGVDTDVSHGLFRHTIEISAPLRKALDFLSDKVTFDLVILNPRVAQLERRGQRMVQMVFDELLNSPDRFIPKHSLKSLIAVGSERRAVCDYVAGMTDPYAERVYHRLFTPGAGSSWDEL